ncbi:MAG TPA: hypothetical protein VM888_03165, partial [Chitinophagaceae bacterium]|nr:hypothetical protein [Chitinophagaceae bacterium]
MCRIAVRIIPIVPMLKKGWNFVILFIVDLKITFSLIQDLFVFFVGCTWLYVTVEDSKNILSLHLL